MTAVELSNVVKSFGRVRALDELSLMVPRGSLCGVVGPNGSGKSTLFSTIAGLLRCDSGQIDVLGNGAFDARKSCGRLSLMPQDSVPSPHSTIRQNLLFYAELQGMTAAQAVSDVDYWLEKVSLSERAEAKFSQLSHGMKRRFSIAQAFLGNPEIILLDEPTAGLDPELAAAMRSLFSEQRGRVTLIISSHNLEELQALCDYIVILEKGRLVKQGSLVSLLGLATRVSLRLRRKPDLNALKNALPDDFEISWSEPVLEVRAQALSQVKAQKEPEEINALILSELLAQGVGIVALQSGNSLESSYLETKVSTDHSREQS